MARKQLVIKQLVILSTTEKSARLVKFHPKRNLITGNNDVGKSSIIKTIYHTFGADVEFKSRWKGADVISYVAFTFDGVDYGVLRSRKQFGIFDGNNNLLRAFSGILNELSPFFANLFGNKLQLKSKPNGKRILAPPAIQFSPFYVDQDKGWTSPWTSFTGIGMLTSYKRDLVDFIVGIKPNEWYVLSERIDEISAKVTELNSEVRTLKAAKLAVSKHLPNSSFTIDIRKFKAEVDNLLFKLTALRNRADEYRSELIKLKSAETYLNQEIAILNNSIKEITKDYSHSLHVLDDEVVCPTCFATYENSMISRFGFLEDVDLCRTLQSDYIDEKKTIQRKIQKLELDLKLQLQKIDGTDSLLNMKKGKVRLKDLLDNESAKHVNNIFRESERGYLSQLFLLENEHLDLKSNRLKLNSKERKATILADFNSVIDMFLVKLNVPAISSGGYKQIPISVDSQGSETPRALLAYYYAILYTLDKYTDLALFPLLIDSPNQQDQDPENRGRIIKFITDNTPDDYQLILGTVDMHGIEFDGNVIEPQNKMCLLNADEYDDTHQFIGPLLDKLHNALLADQEKI